MITPKVGMYVIGDWDHNRTPNKVYKILAVRPVGRDVNVRIEDNEGSTIAEWERWVSQRNVRVLALFKKKKEINV